MFRYRFGLGICTVHIHVCVDVYPYAYVCFCVHCDEEPVFLEPILGLTCKVCVACFCKATTLNAGACIHDEPSCSVYADFTCCLRCGVPAFFLVSSWYIPGRVRHGCRTVVLVAAQSLRRTEAERDANSSDRLPGNRSCDIRRGCLDALPAPPSWSPQRFRCRALLIMATGAVRSTGSDKLGDALQMAASCCFHTLPERRVMSQVHAETETPGDSGRKQRKACTISSISSVVLYHRLLNYLILYVQLSIWACRSYVKSGHVMPKPCKATGILKSDTPILVARLEF